MGLSIGWRYNDVRESIWKDDTAIPRRTGEDGKEVADIPAGALEAWLEDGDASHLEPYATQGEPQRIRFRALTPDEKEIVKGVLIGADNNIEGAGRAWILCFRMAVSFEGAEDAGKDEYGARRRMTSKVRGIPMMANEVVADLERTYPGLVGFYGGLVFNASFLGDVEKKASSPPSTATPSPAVASTADTTAPSPPAEGATGAP